MSCPPQPAADFHAMPLTFPTLVFAALVFAALIFGGQAAAQTPAFSVELPADAPGAAGVLTAAQLDQLAAPIALYPDPVLTDILAAATYPAQIVEAARFAASHDALRGAALSDAAARHNWDPSVQALLAFPPVLHMLDGNLEWTDQLGHAFMTQQADVLDAIQRLRLMAERAGTLQNGPDASVVNDGGAIAITPPSPQSVYLPSYDAGCVYGGDLAGCAGPADAIGWDDGVFLPFGFEQWGLLDWGDRHIHDVHHGGGVWHGGSAGRGGGEWRAAGSPHAPGAVWRPGRAQGFSGRIEARSADPYFYAPPAGALQPGYGVPHPVMTATHFAPSGAMRPAGMLGGPRMARGPSGGAPMARAGFAPMGFGGHR